MSRDGALVCMVLSGMNAIYLLIYAITQNIDHGGQAAAGWYVAAMWAALAFGYACSMRSIART